MSNHENQSGVTTGADRPLHARHIPGDETRLPSEPYRSSSVFTADTLPAALQREHRTKRDVWAIICVLEGELIYCREDGSAPQLLAPQSPGLVLPDEPHHVELTGPVSVRIDFYDHEPVGGIRSFPLLP